MTHPIAPGRAFAPPPPLPEPDPQMVKAAKGMETLFLDQLMQIMRKTVPKNAMGMDSNAVQIYRQMLDSEYAKVAANTSGIGLADQIIAYLQRSRYNYRRNVYRDPTGGHKK